MGRRPARGVGHLCQPVNATAMTRDAGLDQAFAFDRDFATERITLVP
jgi:hypothetical protein